MSKPKIKPLKTEPPEMAWVGDLAITRTDNNNRKVNDYQFKWIQVSPFVPWYRGTLTEYDWDDKGIRQIPKQSMIGYISYDILLTLVNVRGPMAHLKCDIMTLFDHLPAVMYNGPSAYHMFQFYHCRPKDPLFRLFKDSELSATMVQERIDARLKLFTLLEEHKFQLGRHESSPWSCVPIELRELLFVTSFKMYLIDLMSFWLVWRVLHPQVVGREIYVNLVAGERGRTKDPEVAMKQKRWYRLEIELMTVRLMSSCTKLRESYIVQWGVPTMLSIPTLGDEKSMDSIKLNFLGEKYGHHGWVLKAPFEVIMPSIVKAPRHKKYGTAQSVMLDKGEGYVGADYARHMLVHAWYGPWLYSLFKHSPDNMDLLFNGCDAHHLETKDPVLTDLQKRRAKYNTPRTKEPKKGIKFTKRNLLGDSVVAWETSTRPKIMIEGGYDHDSVYRFMPGCIAKMLASEGTDTRRLIVGSYLFHAGLGLKEVFTLIERSARLKDQSVGHWDSIKYKVKEYYFSNRWKNFDYGCKTIYGDGMCAPAKPVVIGVNGQPLVKPSALDALGSGSDIGEADKRKCCMLMGVPTGIKVREATTEHKAWHTPWIGSPVELAKVEHKHRHLDIGIDLPPMPRNAIPSSSSSSSAAEPPPKTRERSNG
jgi:hypothetical protein